MDKNDTKNNKNNDLFAQNRKSWTPRASSEKKQNGSNLKIGKDNGRVKVYVRIRPFLKDEGKNNEMAFEISENSQLKVAADERGFPEKNYNFDHIFHPNKTNEEVCKVLTEPLMQAATNGFNGTLMAYGQTGSGKTYSLMSDTGITRSLIDRCFEHIQKDLKHSYKVNVSYLQIYQEKIYDLLNNHGKGELAIRENPKTGVYVENMTEYVARSPAEVIELIDSGKKRLVFAETKMNRTSSRSHAVLQMTIERQLNEDLKEKENPKEIMTPLQPCDSSFSLDLDLLGKGVIIKGKIHICDLAGSERIKRTGVSGERLNEAQHINSSLLELGNVIAALADESASHIPFRNSILTRLLQESLGGNCKTSLVVCISPAFQDLQETKCTLNFGQRAMKVKNTAYVNMEVDFKSLSDQLLKKLEAKDEEIDLIRRQCNEEIQLKCSHLQEEILRTKLDHREEMKLHKKNFEDKTTALNKEITALEEKLSLKKNEVVRYEDYILSLNDQMENEKRLVIAGIEVDSALEGFCMPQHVKVLKKKDIGGFFEIIRILIQHIKEIETILSSQPSIMVSALERLKRSLIAVKNETNLLTEKKDVLLQKLFDGKENLNGLLKIVSAFDESYRELHQLVYKYFLKSYLQKIIAFAQHFSYRIEYSILSKFNKSLSNEIAQIKCNSTLESHNEVNEKSTKDSFTKHGDKTNFTMRDVEVQTIECPKKTTNSVGIQVSKKDIKSVTANPLSCVPFSVTTSENTSYNNVNTLNVLEPVTFLSPKRVLTTTVENQEKIVTEIATEDILDNPLSIEDTKSIFLNFSSTLDRIEGLVQSDRKTKLDSLKSKLNMYSSKPNSGKPSLLGFGESSVTGNNSKSYTESFNLYMKNRNYEDDMTKNYREETNGDLRKLVSIEMESKALQNNCKALEIEIEQVRKDNHEYLQLLQDLSHINVFTNHLSDVKKQIQQKCDRKPQATQTDDTFDKKEPNKFNNSQKITAHIKPLQSNNRSYSPGSFINLSYDMSENDTLTNISTVFEISDQTYLHKNQNGNSRRAWDIKSPPRDSLSPIPNNEIEFKQAAPPYLQNVFSRLRNKSTDEYKPPRARPTTWYGTNHYDENLLKDNSLNLDEYDFEINSKNSWLRNGRNTNV
ncbi:kinesin-like protein KIF3A isoform X5 [Hydra vulgaris]